MLFDTGDLGDDVVEAFQVLDVYRGDHRDPGVEQLLDILPPLFVLAARCIGVSEFVDQDHLRVPRQHGRHVKFGKRTSAIFDIARRDDLDALNQLSGFRSSVGLDHGGRHVGAAFQAPVRLSEHRVRLTDTRSRTEVDAQLPALGMVVLQADVAHVNHHPPTALARDRIPVIELQVELQRVHRRLTDKAKGAGAAVLREDRSDLIRADVPGLGHPGDLDVGVGR